MATEAQTGWCPDGANCKRAQPALGGKWSERHAHSHATVPQPLHVEPPEYDYADRRRHRAGRHRKSTWMTASLSGLAGVILLPLAPSWAFWTAVTLTALLWAFVGVCELVEWRHGKRLQRD